MARSWDKFLQKRSASKEDISFLDERASAATGRGRKKEPSSDDGWRSFYDDGAEIRSIPVGRKFSRDDSYDRPPLSSARTRVKYGAEDYQFPKKTSSILPYQRDNRLSRDFRLRNRIYDDDKAKVNSQAQIKKAQASEYTENDAHGFKKGSPSYRGGSTARAPHEASRDEGWSDRSRQNKDALQECRTAGDLETLIGMWEGLNADNLFPIWAVKRLGELRAPRAEQIKVLDLLLPKILELIESQSKLKEATDLPSALGNNRDHPRWKKEGAGFDWVVSYAFFHIVKMGHYDSDHARLLIDVIVRDEFKMIYDLSSRSLPQAMWCIAKIKIHGSLPEIQGGIDGLTKAFMKACIKLLEAGQSHPLFLSNAAWSLGSLGVKGELSDRVARMLSSSARTEMSSLLASFLPSKKNEHQTGEANGQFHEVSLATFCHGLSQMNHYDAATMQMAGDLMADMYERRNIQDLRPLASFLFACGTLIHYDASLMRRFSAIVTQALSNQDVSYAPVSINHIIWAFSVLKYYDAQLVESVAQWTIRNAERLVSIRKDQNLSLICWSLMNLGHEGDSARKLIEVTSSKVMEEVERVPEGNDEKLSDTITLFHHVANYAHSILILSPDRTDLMAKFIKLSLPLIQKLKDQGIIDELVAAVRETRDPPAISRVDTKVDKLLKDTIDHGMVKGNSHHGPFIACRSLWAVHLELVDRGLADQALQSWQLEACKEMWASSPTRISPYQKEVLAVVQSIEIPGSKARSEVETEDGMFSMDIFIEKHPKWGRVAIEVDGPFHFFSNLPSIPHGKARLRNRFLTRRVDKLISINLDNEWKQIEDVARQKEFISKLLA